MRAKYFYGYNIVAAGFAIQAVSIGALFAYGVFFKEFQAEFGWTRATISGASSLAFLVMGVAGILAGRLNDRIGPRILIAVAGAALGTGYLLMSYMLFLFAVIYGFAHGGLFTVMSPTVAELFGTGSHGLLFGIVLFSGTLGGAIGPLMAGRIFDLTASYQLVFLILTAMALVGIILITTLRPPVRNTGSN